MTIRFDQLSYSYGRVTALRDISVEAASGTVTAIIGPNAAGKSTLLRCAVGSLRPNAGAVLIDGSPAHRMRARELASNIAYVPQRSTVSIRGTDVCMSFLVAPHARDSVASVAPSSWRSAIRESTRGRTRNTETNATP